MAAPKTNDLLAKGETVSKVRDEAFESYSRVTDLVREKLKELELENREGQRVAAKLDQLERSLAVAERLKDLTVLELQHADETWREWREEVRAQREEERQTRQDKSTTSATVAAWAAAIAAIASVFVAAWQVFRPFHP